jgi:hypothetical protein
LVSYFLKLRSEFSSPVILSVASESKIHLLFFEEISM